MRKENPARFSSAVGEAWMHCEFKVKYCHKLFDDEMFHQIHFVEKWGRGIGLILSKEPNTEFKEVGRQFIVIFKRKAIPETREKTGEKTREKIIQLMRENPKITTQELAKRTD